MKTLGLIGGMSWESTERYYRLLNEMARDRLGGLHSAELLLWSFDFAEIETLQASGDWDAASVRMVDAARRLADGGAAAVVLCSNTMHLMAPTIEAAVDIPLLHIADATADVVKASPSRRPALLATRYTMEQDFYIGRLRDPHGLEPVVPGAAGRKLVHRVIYEELCQGVVRAESREAYLDLLDDMRTADGIDGVVLGCTEVGLLISARDVELPVFDSTAIHAAAAIEFALS